MDRNARLGAPAARVNGKVLFGNAEAMPAFLQEGADGLEHRPHDATPQVGKVLQEQGVVGLGLLLRYTQALITQMAQTAVCNRHHALEQQLCRWLLLSLDRLPANELVMTQELIANMLGVRREGVTEAAGNLQKARLINYSRGHITVLDRPKLEARVCECYAVVKREYDRLIPSASA